MNLKIFSIVFLLTMVCISALNGQTWTTTFAVDNSEPNFIEWNGVVDIDSGETAYTPEFSLFDVKDHKFDLYLYTTTNGDSIRQTAKLQAKIFGEWKDLQNILTNDATSDALKAVNITLANPTALDALRLSITPTIYAGDTTAVRVNLRGLRRSFW